MSYFEFPKNCQIPDLSRFYEEVFGRCSTGCFVEVGGYDGNNFSNTSGLADRGWRGIYIEPVPDFAKLCRGRHACNKKVRVVEVAVSDYIGRGVIHLGEALSTLLIEQVDDYDKIGWARGLHLGHKVEVRVTNMDALLCELSVKKGFDVLVVDVEGAEREVFAKLDLERWRPKLVIAELEDFHPDFRNNYRVVETATYVRQKLMRNYSIIYQDSINSIYMRNDIQRRFNKRRRYSGFENIWPFTRSEGSDIATRRSAHPGV
jgi:FkbM family methyltransferase